MTPSRRALIALVPLLVATSIVRQAPAAEPINAPGGLAIRGYDVVAYFTLGKATRGEAEFAVPFEGVTFRFVSAAHRAQFTSEPTRYLPAYGGYSAFGVAAGRLVPGDPELFAIVDGRLFLNAARDMHVQWQRDPARYIAAADEKWPALKSRF